MFSVGTACYADVEGARLAAQLGNAATTDDQSITLIRDRVETTGIFSVDEVDIYKLNQDASGNLTPDSVFYNKYRIDGTPLIPEPWPAASRNVGNGTSNFLGVTSHFTYDNVTAMAGGMTSANLQETDIYAPSSRDSSYQPGTDRLTSTLWAPVVE